MSEFEKDLETTTEVAEEGIEETVISTEENEELTVETSDTPTTPSSEVLYAEEVPTKKKGKKAFIIIGVIVALIAVLTVVLIMVLNSKKECEHEYSDATCTQPKTCSKCGREKGDLLDHSWEDATCTQPKTCSKCGKEEGDKIDHTILADKCTACNESLEKIQEECEHDWSDATCTDPQICRLCQKTSGDALGHTSNSGTCSRCYEKIGNWEIGQFKDEFGQPLGSNFVLSSTHGTFSNSATTNSDLLVALRISSTTSYSRVEIALAEYGSNIVKCSYKYDDYSVTMLDTSGKKHYLSGTMYAGSHFIVFSTTDENTIINALKRPGEVSFYVELDDRVTTNYLFTINTSNFKELYESLS